MHHWTLLVPLSVLLSINVQSPLGSVLAQSGGQHGGYFDNHVHDSFFTGSPTHSLESRSDRQHVPWELEKWPTILETIWVLSNDSLCGFCQQVNLYLKHPAVHSCLSYVGRTSAKICDFDEFSRTGSQERILGSEDTSWLWLTYEELKYHSVRFAWSGHNKFVFLANHGDITVGLELQNDSYGKLKRADILPDECFMGQHETIFPFGHQCSRFSLCTQDTESTYNCTCVTAHTTNDFDCQLFGSTTLQSVVLAVQICSIIFAFGVSMFVVLARKFKVMMMWPINVTLVVGCVFLYVTVILRLQEGSTTICVLEPWFRELGFALCYGSIVLKIYRALVEFRTRKAHRWVVREKDILRYLSTIICVVLFYMSAWTTISWPLPATIQCSVTGWHRLTEIEELLFLGVGLNMAYHLRNAQQCLERHLLTAALIIEILAAITTLIFRETLSGNGDNPDFSLILYFTRIQLTTTTILLLLFTPKVYHVMMERKKRLLRRGETARVIKTALDNGAGDLDLAEVSLADMDPQDIRNELKRVYTQLEVLRNKTMRKDNPHISKRRGGRKTTHRRFSLQKKGSRDKQRRNKEFNRSFRYTAGGEENEDSVCSIEGPSTYSEFGYR